MTTPRVSVVIPTYNRADLLPRALDSVIAQSINDLEIVLIDDGSSDATAQVAERYATRLGNRFVYQRQSNRGCCAARNKGIELARGDFVAFLDADDEFTPTKLERQLSLFEQCPHLGLVFSDYTCVDLAEQRIESAFAHFYPVVRSLPTREIAPRLHECTESIFEPLLRGYFIATIVGMVRRDVLSREIRFLDRPSYAHEWLFYLQVLKRAQAGYVDEPLSVHHFMSGSITRTDSRRNNDRLFALLGDMRKMLAPINRRQHRIIKRHRFDAARSLGNLAYREGKFAESAKWFWQAFRHSPNPRCLYDLLDATGRRFRQHAGSSLSPRQT